MFAPQLAQRGVAAMNRFVSARRRTEQQRVGGRHGHSGRRAFSSSTQLLEVLVVLYAHPEVARMSFTVSFQPTSLRYVMFSSRTTPPHGRVGIVAACLDGSAQRATSPPLHWETDGAFFAAPLLASPSSAAVLSYSRRSSATRRTPKMFLPAMCSTRMRRAASKSPGKSLGDRVCHVLQAAVSTRKVRYSSEYVER